VLRHARPVGVLGVALQFCPPLTTVVAGKPSAESFSWLPPRQLTASTMSPGATNQYGSMLCCSPSRFCWPSLLVCRFRNPHSEIRNPNSQIPWPYLLCHWAHQYDSMLALRLQSPIRSIEKSPGPRRFYLLLFNPFGHAASCESINTIKATAIIVKMIENTRRITVRT
jgi:hypothetical protein